MLVVVLMWGLPQIHQRLVGTERLVELTMALQPEVAPSNPAMKEQLRVFTMKTLALHPILDPIRALLLAAWIGGVTWAGLRLRTVRVTMAQAIGVGVLSVVSGAGAWAVAYGIAMLSGGMTDPGATWQATAPLDLGLVVPALRSLVMANLLGIPWVVQMIATTTMTKRMAGNMPPLWHWVMASLPLLVAALVLTVMRQAL